MQGNVNIPDSTITSALTFRQLVLMNMQQLTNFPYIENDFDALTDYELLCLVVKYLNDVIANQNEQNDSITSMYESFLALQTYVNNTKDTLEDAFNSLDNYVRNFFDNLDLQDEVDHKLDEMLESGVLEQIIEQFLQSSALWCFDNVSSMKAATNLVNGSYVKTIGYYSLNDGGESNYKIRTKTVEDVPNDGDLIAIGDTLVAELIIKNNTVNVKQFGAYGDGETDDVTYIQNAINSNAKIINFLDNTYMINDTLTFKSKSYIGNNPTLILGTQTTSREHVIRNENYGVTTQMDNISMKGLTIINNSNEKAFGFSCSKVVVENCKFYAYDLDTQSLLDLYGNNSDSVIKDSYFFISVDGSDEKGTSLLIRGFHGGITKNVLVSNCYFEQNCKDEILWINAGVCPIEDVIVENCTFKSTGSSSNLIWISNASSTGDTTYIKNVTFNNNFILENDFQNRIISVCRTEYSDYQNTLNVKNINISNNIINIKDQTTATHTSVITYGYDDTTPELIVNNNKIIMEGTNNAIEYLFNGKIKSYNNEFNLTDAQFVYYGCYEVKGDTISQCQHIGRNVNIIDNITATSSSSAVHDLSSPKYYSKTIIRNSNITCTNLFSNGNNNTGRIYEAINNIINNSSHIYNNYNGDNTNVLKLSNNVLSYITYYINNVACQLHLGINYDSNGDIIKGIPANALNRQSCVVGTILFSSTQTKSIVRKISAGDETSNWEEI